ncbi:SRPBCC family protein [Microtetraspora niveoalba]|uniref:SRPBCC family protein n=1 Tax=Microtetraspora niveoalba TaxID=46175 RepID=UPI00082B7350|nr:carbon monoxide dehydrogenase subunit G [Microtetraspora niveoalba]
MKITGSAVLGVERGRVWTALRDPGVLVCTIPGCERLEAVGDDVYKMTVNAGVASIKGIYQGEVALSDPHEPERFVLRARGQGAPGTVDATVRIRLSEVEGGTRVDYDAEAVVGGMIGGVGQRMLGSVAKKTAGEFFTAVEEHLRSAVAAAVETTAVLDGRAALGAPASPETAASAGTPTAVPHEAGVAAGTGDRAGAGAGEAGGAFQAVPYRPVAGQVFTRETAAAARPQRTSVPPWTMLAAFGMGAGVALGSAVIGWVLGRQRR